MTTPSALRAKRASLKSPWRLERHNRLFRRKKEELRQEPLELDAEEIGAVDEGFDDPTEMPRLLGGGPGTPGTAKGGRPVEDLGEGCRWVKPFVNPEDWE